MDCKNIGLLMHQVLDEPEKMLKQREIIDSHCQQCPTCSSLWFELQQIENGLFEMDVVELPVDFSTIDWELLMQTETEMAESFSTSMGIGSNNGGSNINIRCLGSSGFTRFLGDHIPGFNCDSGNRPNKRYCLLGCSV